MQNKLRLAHMSLYLMTALTITAVNARPGYSRVTLPDGSEMKVRLIGDEHFHYYESEDGMPIEKQADGWFTYVTLDTNGDPVDSKVPVRPLANRELQEARFVSTIDKSQILHKYSEKGEQRRNLKLQHRPKATYPTKGNLPGLVILVEYSDLKFSIPGANQVFTDMMNKEDFSEYSCAGSVRDWFVDNSGGQFTPSFDVYGPIELPHNMSYYGENDSSGDDIRPYEMVLDACSILDDDIDFSQYDCDGDGAVDNVYIFYAGYGENLGGNASASSVWPHSADMTEWTPQEYTHDGVRINHYACSNEINLANTLDGIGTFCHEFSHVLGLPDLYATNYSTAFTPGQYSVMDSGCYNNDSRTPNYYTAYERYFLGWLTPREIGKPARITLDEISTNQACIIKTDDENEYFLLENRQQKGWDKYIPGHGMLIWHIDYNELVWNANEVNNKKSHQYVDIEEADNIQSDGTVAGDPFPGTYNITTFSDDTAPGMLTWEGVGQNKPITEISENNGVITFLISGGKENIESVEALEAADVTATSFTARWSASAEATGYLLSVYHTETLPSGKISYVYVDGLDKKDVGNVTEYLVSGLDALTEYKYSVRCYDVTTGMESVASNEVMVVTDRPSFEMTSAVACEAESVTESGFEARWNAMDGAEGYLLNVYTLQGLTCDDDMVEQNFTGGISELGAGWDTNSTQTYSLSSYCGDAVPSLRLGSEGSYISSPKFTDYINELLFWQRGNNSSEGSKLVVRAYSLGEWQEVASFDVNNAVGGEYCGADNSLGEGKLPYQCESISITYEPTGKGSVAIDDIRIWHGNYSVPIYFDGFEKRDVGNVTSCYVTIDNPDLVYDGIVYYTVQGYNGDLISKASNIIRVGIASDVKGVVEDKEIELRVNGGEIYINVKESSEVKIYTLSGIMLKDEDVLVGENRISLHQQGLYLVRVGGNTYKLEIK